MSSSIVEFKIYYDQKMKRFLAPQTLSELFSIVSQIFSIEFNSANFNLFYVDNEEDAINLTNEFDYEQLILYTKNHSIKLVKLGLTSKDAVPEQTNQTKPSIQSNSNQVNHHKSLFEIAEEIKKCLDCSDHEDKEILNAVVLANGNMEEAKVRLSANKKYCHYFDKRKYF